MRTGYHHPRNSPQEEGSPRGGQPVTYRVLQILPKSEAGEKITLKGENAKSTLFAELDHANEGMVMSLGSRGDTILIISEDNAMNIGVHISFQVPVLIFFK